MTSEAKPNYEEFSLEICQIAFEGGDADGASIQDIGVKHGVLREEIFNHKKHSDVVNAEYFEDGQTVYCFVAPHAVPDVPELVRYGNYIDNCMHVKPTGEYVRYDQAAAMIAAKDKEIQELKEKLGVVSTERHADAEYIGHLQAELVYLKAQEPVAWMHPEAGWTDVSKAEVSAQCKPSTYPKPLYAAPVDQTAEIERLRGYVAGLVTWIEDEVGAELPFAIDRTALSGKEPS